MNRVNSRRIARKPGQAGAFRRTLLSLALACCFEVGVVQGQPLGPQVVSGQASFVTQGSTLTITNSPQTIINWQGFSIGANELTRFNQQNSSSAVLNRVIGNDGSAILGALQSNGQVYLINPSGIFFGPGARIDVAGLVASSLDLGNQDFLAGRYNFKGGVTAGKLENQGSITTPEGGRIYLIAPNVENSGILSSPKGDILLAAGHSVQLVDSANPDMRVVVSAANDQTLNLGQIVANSGRIGIYGALVSQRGNVSADSAVVGENGKIVFKASRDTLIEGSVSATGAGKGGEIQVLGERVAILDGAKLDASGQSGGGTVLVGGDYQGKNPAIQNAQRTYLGSHAEIRADALDQGDGGRIIVWSDQATRVYGSLSARGGQGGQGGFIETSGHYLDVAGIKVDSGGKGVWLLDPYDIEVVASGGSTVLGDFDQFADAPASGVSTISNATISGASSTVTLQATHDITVTAPIAMSVSGVALTIKAGNDIKINDSVSSTAGTITLSANDSGGPASGAGAVRIAAGKSVASSGGTINISAADLDLQGTLDAGAGDVSIASTGNGGIGVGTAAGQMSISATELQGMTAANLKFNSGGGALQIAGDLNFGSSGLLLKGQSVSQSSGGISASSVALDSVANTTLNSTTNQIGLLSGSIGGDLDFYTSGALNVNAALTASGQVKLRANTVSQEGAITATTLDVKSLVGSNSGMISLIGNNQVSNLKAEQADSNGFGISFHNAAPLTINSIINSSVGTNGGAMVSTTSGNSIAIAGPITLTASGAELVLAVQNNAQGPFGGITCSGSCLVSANNIQLDAMRGTTGASGAPLKTQSIGGGDLTLKLGNSDYPYGALYVEHDGNAALTSLHLNPTDVGVSIKATGNLTLTNLIDAGTGTVTLGAGGTLSVPVNTSIKGANITLAGNRVNIDTVGQTPAVIDAGSGEVWFKPYALDGTVGVNVVATKPGTANMLELTPAEVTGVTAGTIRVGSTLAGGLSINNTVSTSATLILEAGGDITQGASGSLSTTNLGIRALGNVDLTNASSIVANLVAEIGDSSHLNKNFSFKNAGNLNIGKAIDGMNGIWIHNDGQDYLPASSNGVITLDAAPGGAISQDALGTLNAKALSVVGSNVVLAAGNNQVSAIAGRSVSGTSGTVFEYSAAVPIHLTTVGSQSGIKVVNSDGIRSSGDIVLTSILPGNVIASGTSGITQDDSSGILSTAGGVLLRSDGSALLDNSANSVGKLAADLRVGGPGAGTLYYKNSGSVAVDSVAGTNGVLTNNRDVTLITGSGDLSVSQSVNAGTGSATLKAGGDNSVLSIASGKLVTGKATSSAGVTLVADRVDIAGNVDATSSGEVAIYSYTAGRSVALGAGGADVSALTASGGTLALDTTEAAKISAATLRVGNTTSGGAITASDSFTWGGSGLLRLWSAGGISTDSGKTLTSAALELLSGGAIAVTSDGNIVLGGPVSAATTVTLTSLNGAILNTTPSPLATAVVTGSRVTLSAKTGIGATVSPIKTHAVELAASTSTSGNIALLNNSPYADPALTSAKVTLKGVTNSGSGSVSVENYGELNTGTDAVSAGGGVILKANSPLVIGSGGVSAGGAVSLTAGGSGPGNDLTVSGSVSSTGAVTLTSGNNLTVNSNISSTGGGVTLTANNNVTLSSGTSVSAGGTGTISVAATNGGITATGATLTIPAGSTPIAMTAATTVTGAPAGATVTQGTSSTPSSGGAVTTPTLSQCTANPALAGCSTVLPTLSQCTVTPTLAGCSAVLPSTSQCTTNPTLAGCSTVLPSTSQCVTTPTLAGCSAVLPTLSQCTATPTLAGCSSVLPTLSQCTANPALAGCSSVLPSTSQCATNPVLTGCSAVLPSISQCTTNSALAGCSSVLPTLSQCTTSPSLAGCSAVLPTLVQCVATPILTGCSAVLPSAGQCAANPTLYGCAAILPTLSQCLLNPTLAGCSAVLPAASQCAATPTLPGCSTVLPTLSQCTATPTLAGCSAVLPSIGQCAATPSLPGCSLILPTLGQCAVTPSLPGCSLILPTLGQCAATPSLPGCSLILPTLSQCTVTPTLAGCSTVLPSTGQCAATPTLPGCSSILPTLSQCTATPTLAGCSAVLPSTSQCAATPALTGCVAPPPASPDPCIANPGVPGCLSQGGSAPLEQALNQTNNTINNSSSTSATQPLTNQPSQQGGADGTGQNLSLARGGSSSTAETSTGSDDKDDKKNTRQDAVKKGSASAEDRKNDAPSKKQYCN
ncbi:MAG: filamentous hemagglutinin N-terminal domain-containing protein [Sulfuricella sp.]|nr:filamentous hemagglutinin N-terminal domain-containing protein [Sulfuricella sp.]